MPCCERTPFEVSRTDRMTVHSELVDCEGMMMKLDLTKERSPAEIRNLLEVRVRRLDATESSSEEIDEALEEIEAISRAALNHRSAR